jgi:hypothetical protein
MNHVLEVSQTVLAFAAVVLLCLFLKHRSIIKAEHGPHRTILLDYFRSPIFIALAAGLLIAPLHLNPESPFLGPFL